MKGILLAGGKGTRFSPTSQVVSKHLLPVYDKPLIYYSLSTLMLLDIKDILIITTPESQALYSNLLGDGKQLGLRLIYKLQEKPRGIAEAFIIAEEFIENDNICLMLGDNLFYNLNFISLKRNIDNIVGAKIFALWHKNPSHYGVVEFDKNKDILSIEEKPHIPKSNYIVPGLYFYDNQVIEVAKRAKYSERGELEITSINNYYLSIGKISLEVLNKSVKWFDVGNPTNLLNASTFVKQFQRKKGKNIACIEEIAYRQGYIGRQELLDIAKHYLNTKYGSYIMGVVNNEI